jgi:hypothetical protein
MGNMGIADGSQIHGELKQIYDAHQQSVKEEQERRISATALRSPKGFSGPRYGSPPGMEVDYTPDDWTLSGEDSCGGDEC